MIKFILSLVLTLFLAISSAFSAPCYGTKMPQANQYFSGFQTHLLLERDLEAEYGSLRSAQNFLGFSYGFFDWLTIDLKIGVGNLKQHPVDSDEVDYNSSFAGGYGVRFKLYDNQKKRLVFGFHHISVHPYSIDLDGIENRSILDDWQVSMLASYSFSKVTPYLGTKWSRVDYIHWVDDQRKRRMSDLTKGVGLVLGLDIPLSDRTWLNLEGQLFDGKALASSLNISF
ncbi:MAG: hypothetical protein K9L86_04055 [Candidatus Omnitrophica bacterium]|nr:hypothetical protein [Candidatus Omnitrophota bacterium]